MDFSSEVCSIQFKSVLLGCAQWNFSYQSCLPQGVPSALHVVPLKWWNGLCALVLFKMQYLCLQIFQSISTGNFSAGKLHSEVLYPFHHCPCTILSPQHSVFFWKAFTASWCMHLTTRTTKCRCTWSVPQLHTTGLAMACSLLSVLKGLGAVQDHYNADVTHGKCSVPDNARGRIEGCWQMFSAVVRSNSKPSTWQLYLASTGRLGRRLQEMAEWTHC